MSNKESLINTLCELIDSDVVTQAQIAREVGRSSAAISGFINGKYNGNNEDLAEALIKWLETHHQRQQLPDRPQFVMTPTVEDIWSIFDSVRLLRCINVIVGSSGVGKTHAAEQYQRSNPNTWMMTLCPAYSSVTQCLLEMAGALGMDNPPANKGTLTRKIRQRLSGKEGLMIVDEADHLSIDGFEQLRAIQDATGVGMVFIGNPDGLSKVIKNTYSNNDLTRLRSRVARFKSITKPKRADVKAIADAWNITGKEELALMNSIAIKPGALRVLSYTLGQAWIIASGSGQETLTEKYIEAAFKEVSGALNQ